MNLNTLRKTKIRGKKRVGRGYGSGRGGHTSSRGQKGQKSHARINSLFEGTKVKKSLLKRLPLLRGKGKFKSRKAKPFIVNLKYLNLFAKDEVVDVPNLIKHDILGEEAKVCGVKILGEGELVQALTVKVPVSAGARAKIEKAGGKVVNT